MSEENNKKLMSLAAGSSKNTDDIPSSDSGGESDDKPSVILFSPTKVSFCKASQLLKKTTSEPLAQKIAMLARGNKRSLSNQQDSSAEGPKRKHRNTTTDDDGSTCNSNPDDELDDEDIEDQENSSNLKKEPGSLKRDNAYYFGLFGMTEKCDENEQPNYFQWLPVPIIENILCHVPFLDLLNFRLVSKAWNEVIKNQKFVQWKKAYYRFKMLDEKTDCFQAAVSENSFSLPEDCIPSLVKFMTFKFMHSAVPKVLSIEKNPKYQLILEVIAERFPDIQPRQVNVWTILAMSVVLAESVYELESVFHCLIQGDSPLSICDVLNAMYCMATFYMYFIKELKLNHGFHYHLYYVLHTFENTTPKKLSFNVQCLKLKPTTSGQQSMHSYCQPTQQKLTYEQLRFLNHELRPGQIVKIIAFAGTGKTTTLVHYAKLYPQLKFLNVVFNKSASKHAAKIFPKNVECRTAHSLAYRAVGKSYRHKLRTKLKPHDVVPHMDIPSTGKFCHMFTFAKLVLETINNFCSSPDENISLSHVPADEQIYPPQPVLLNTPPLRKLTPGNCAAILQAAVELWEKMKDQKNPRVGIVHDTYLKLYQLSHPKYSGYDCIMIDEAQDSNTAMLDIMLSQNLPVILVGDPNQQIYGFRGAKNSLQQVNAECTYHLTKSFRFGPEIAYVASCCLETLKENFKDTIVGSVKPSSISGKIEGQYAVIARTNAQLFNQAIRLCCTELRYDGEPENIQGAFVGGISGYDLGDLLDIYNLVFGCKDLKDRFLKKFECFNSLYDYAKRADDDSLLKKIDFVRQKGRNLPENVKTIKKKCHYPLELANVVFSTVHKAKGLEFDTVYIADDFSVGDILTPGHTRRERMSEEYNLLYVALTRAKKCLVLSEVLMKSLLVAQEKFECLKSSSLTLLDKISLTCVGCQSTFVPKTSLTMWQKGVSLSSGQKIPEGPKCLKCACKMAFRPQINRGEFQILLDPIQDKHHQSLLQFVGPRPGEPPVPQEDFAERAEVFHLEMGDNGGNVFRRFQVRLL